MRLPILLALLLLTSCRASREQASARIRSQEAQEWAHRRTTQPNL